MTSNHSLHHFIKKISLKFLSVERLQNLKKFEHICYYLFWGTYRFIIFLSLNIKVATSSSKSAKLKTFDLQLVYIHTYIHTHICMYIFQGASSHYLHFARKIHTYKLIFQTIIFQKWNNIGRLGVPKRT